MPCNKYPPVVTCRSILALYVLVAKTPVAHMRNNFNDSLKLWMMSYLDYNREAELLCTKSMGIQI